MSTILITGGAGYIGSHVNKHLAGLGRDTVVFDNLTAGHRDFCRWGELVAGDLADTDLLAKTMREKNVTAVMHFAAHTAVGESVADPLKYYDNNLAGTLSLMAAMRRAGVGRMVFSSSASVYGVPRTEVIEEDHPLDPISPYARSKAVIEAVLADLDTAHGIKSVSLRYFNAAGADPDGEVGERHDPETHLIPLVLMAALGLRPEIAVFGDDYPTPDGTCVRDYIHVTDLARAHGLALDHLESGGGTRAYNLGNARGTSVLEVIDTARRVTGRDIPMRRAGRRPGDAPVLVGGSRRIKKELGWKPELENLERIVETAWQWHCKDTRK